MRRAAAVLAAAACAAVAGGARAALPTIYVTYDVDSCTFAVRSDAGKPVTSVAPGTYQLSIATNQPYGSYDTIGRTDDYACHGFVQFRMTGPGVGVTTTLDYGDDATELDTVVLKPGATYTLQDDTNAAGSRRTISVADSGQPTPPPTPSTGASTPSQPPRGLLNATVAAKGAVTLTRGGRPFAVIAAGQWQFSVRDTARTRGFSVRAPNGSVRAITSNVFVGVRDVTLALTPGRWSFFTTGGKKTSFLVR